MKIKRFVLMCGRTYYASGGFYDGGYSWWHVCDLEKGDIYGEGGGCNSMGGFF